MLLESFSQAILKWLRVPPGASIRHASGPGTSSALDIEDNDYIVSILDITVDDICIGDAPLSISCNQDTPETVKLKLQQQCDEWNSVVKDVARDLCSVGYSIWDISYNSKKNQIVVLPFIDSVEFYITKDKNIAIYKQEEQGQLKNKILFINYTKKNMTKVEDARKSKFAFKVTPAPMQLRNVDKTLTAINNAELSLSRYRALLRPVRFANVDIGTAQGDVQKETIDSISSAFNANSESLDNQASFAEFDDNIPVLPNRKGLGKAEMYSDVPAADVKEIADLNYYVGKLNLLTRFPATYMDFTKPLGDTAVSMLRGDLRYVKQCKSVQTKIENTLNIFYRNSKFAKYEPIWSLTTYPTSEDDDVIKALEDYCGIAKEIEEFVIGEPDDTVEIRLHRLRLLKDLFNAAVKSPTLQKWFEDFETFIKEPVENASEESEDFEEFESETSAEPEMSEEPVAESNPDVEIINPQTSEEMLNEV